MKKLLLSVFLLIFFLSFIPVSGQDKNFYFDLVGKDQNYVKKNYPLFDMIPNTSPIFPGQYVVYEMNCEDGGYISVVVEFVQRLLTQKVRSVGMLMEGCWTDPREPDSIYDALGIFSYYFGFNSLADEARVTVEKPNMIMMTMPDVIIFGVFKEKVNGRTVFTASAGTVLE